LLPHVASNVQATFDSTINPGSNNNHESMRNGKKPFKFVEPFEKKP
jgi:hypothetical protein